MSVISILLQMLMYITIFGFIASVYGTTETVKQFCQDILLQPENDTKHCYEKPNTYSNERGDNAALIYMCCVGAFGGVKNDYMPFLHNDFVENMAEMKSDKDVLDFAEFIMACKSYDYRLSKDDFLHWVVTGKSAQSCRVN